MSQKNPNYKEILACTTGVIGRYFCKSYLNLAKMEFRKKHRRCPTIADAQEIRDIYENQWVDYYIHKPARERANREKGRPIWQYGCTLKIDVFEMMCRFMEFMFSDFYPPNHVGKVYPKKSCGDIMKEKNIEFLETFIVDNNLLDDWKKFATVKRKEYPWYRRTYQDYSHLAYNGVTDDF